MQLTCAPPPDLPASIPALELLAEHAPAAAWQAALRAAQRAPQQRFRMGAALLDRRGQVLTTGCSHIPHFRSARFASLHAERHALSRARHLDLTGCSIVVMSLNRRGDGCPWRCCPCAGCAQALHRRGVQQVFYPQRTVTGGWAVVCEHPAALVERAPEQLGVFARHQRIPVAA